MSNEEQRDAERRCADEDADPEITVAVKRVPWIVEKEEKARNRLTPYLITPRQPCGEGFQQKLAKVSVVIFSCYFSVVD